ncbi:hypothetical protein MG293_000375 [Ovis ammon polii]|uniref:Voltage-gated potassium channel subunit beta-1 n=1 Tax=Ovis ammon polii TaxID=230172 RepID=A0AAD4UQE2_OVIAM|nr:hypothetical protein MG293_000375 [Ovis ammon polii]
MQVSIACTEHNLKSRNGEDRLLSKQSSTAPNVVNAARAKFRTVAIIARSLGTFTPQHHISLKESTAKQTGMKYRPIGFQKNGFIQQKLPEHLLCALGVEDKQNTYRGPKQSGTHMVKPYDPNALPLNRIPLFYQRVFTKFAAAAKSLQSCPTLCNPIDGSPLGSSVPGILQARTLEWIAISFSNA